MLFAFLGWYSRDGEDPLLRRHLDAVWDRLHELPPWELLVRAIRRLVRKLGALQQSAAAHLIVWLGSWWWAALGLAWSGWAARAFFGNPERFEFVSFWHPRAHIDWWWFTLVASYSLVSWWVTLRLLRATAERPTKLRALAHLVLDLSVAIQGMAWSMVAVGLVVGLEGWGLSAQALRMVAVFLYLPFMPGAFQAAVSLVGTSAPAVAPSIAYGVLLLILIAAHYAPRPIRSGALRVVYLVSTDKRPILAQLGTFFGTIGALLTLLLR